jgi:hypothetical protein
VRRGAQLYQQIEGWAFAVMVVPQLEAGTRHSGDFGSPPANGTSGPARKLTSDSGDSNLD